MVNIKCSR